MNQDIVLQLALPVTLFCIMFSMGSSLVTADFKRVLETPAAVMVGVISQMVMLPVVALLLLSLLQLPPELFIGFMILAFSPGGTTSNMFSYLAQGDVALSITLTAIVSLVTPLTIPLL
ncbi:MAG: bile acid:sodium symporter, partial [Candidatus Thiodiazotropha taylori]